MEHREFQVPEEIRQQLVSALEASEADPTQKLGLTDRLKNWLKSLVAPKPKTYTDTELDSMPAPSEEPEFKGIQMPPPPGPEPAELPPVDDEQGSLPFGDETEVEPDEYLEKFKKGKEELGSGFDDLLQEIKRRHFK